MYPREELGTGLFGLGLVNEFHEDTLVLEDVTLALHVKLVVPVCNVECKSKAICEQEGRKAGRQALVSNRSLAQEKTASAQVCCHRHRHT